MRIDGEFFELKESEPNLGALVTDDEINQKYLKGEIRIITEQARYPLDSITGMLSSLKYDLNPEYQRRKRWNHTQQSKLIESFIINVPIPPIFLYEVEFAKYEVMDGLQRLTAIDDFYKGKFALTGLEEWKELNGKKYNDLPNKVREGIDRRYLSSIILLNETAKSKEEADFLKQIVFGRLNSGGDKLTAQETRNALYGGKFNTCCIELSKNSFFRKLWGFQLMEIGPNDEIINEDKLLESGDAYRKMEDVELVLRFFAFRHIEKLNSFKSQERFIDEFLNQANNFTDETINSLKNIFIETVTLTYKIFREDAFYMPAGVRNKTTPTKTIYDPLMQSISKILKRKEDLLAKSEIIKSTKFRDEKQLKIKGRDGDVDLFDGKYNNPTNVQSRIVYFDSFFDTILKS
jgi:hypothetical protein